MPSIPFFFGSMDYWSLYHKVTFDGENRIIQIAEGITELSIDVDVYSDWKEWSVLRDNTKYLAAFDESIGGENLETLRKLGSTYFLANGWRIRTWEGDHTLSVTGNIYTVEGDSPFITTREKHTILIQLRTSNLTDSVGDETLTLDSLSSSVWNQPVENHTIADTFGEKFRKNLPR